MTRGAAPCLPPSRPDTKSEKSDDEKLEADKSPPPELVGTEHLTDLESSLPVNEVYEVSDRNRYRCHIYDEQLYKHMYRRSLHDSENFWREMGMQGLRWLRSFTKVQQCDMDSGEVVWFLGGKLNVCDNCVDRWAELYPDKTAIIYEGDEPSNVKHITYKELMTNVCRLANLMKRYGVRKYDTVGIYMPMIPETIYAMLACARLGAVHAVVFAGFSAPNLRDRLVDGHCKMLITADQGMRGGRPIPLKRVADEAVRQCPKIEHCIVFRHIGAPITMVPGRDIPGSEMYNCRPHCPLEWMDSEDLLFILHTSGSTGKPKGVAHSTAGYLLHTAMSFKYVFDYHPGDIYACVADVGWITGHSYVVYGPLCNGATTLLFESVPSYPDAGRYWDMVERHHINQFYTAPTAIRSLMRFGDSFVQKYDRSSLRILGSVGEPINPEAWRWYYNVVGNGRCNVVDTYWQTETGGHCLTPLPGAIRTKPGSATVPFFGIEPAIVDPQSGKEVYGDNVTGLLCFKRAWPGMMRTIYGDHQRMMSGYLQPVKGFFFSGDGAYRDADGYYWILGRVDDTINVAGHRMGSAEIEHALLQHGSVAEAAVVPIKHDVKGSGIFCYVVLKADAAASPPENLVQDLKLCIRQAIGPIATPDYVHIAQALPKTRSGKVMRRLLRKIANGETTDGWGDVTALADSSVLETLNDEVLFLFKKRTSSSCIRVDTNVAKNPLA